MQPLWEVTLRRPWHWGIAIVGSPGSDFPEELAPGLLTVGGGVLVVKVKHAQDVAAERFEGDWDWATAVIRLRSLTTFDDDSQAPDYEGQLDLPGGVLEVGDADSQVTFNDLDEVVIYRIVVVGPSDFGAPEVQIDLAPVP